MKAAPYACPYRQTVWLSLTTAIISGMASTVIYARVPAEIKEAVESHAEARGMTLTAAITDLLRRGLEATENARSAEALEVEVQRLRAQLDGARAEVAGAQTQAQAATASFQSLSHRLGQPLAPCPNQACKGPVRGHDLLVTGRCPRCRTSLALTLADVATGSKPVEKTDDWLLLLGAVGAAIGAGILINSGSKNDSNPRPPSLGPSLSLQRVVPAKSRP